MILKKCLFPVAGYGTRFLPATKAVPKEMLPILTKPLIQYGVEEAMSADISSIAMITNLNKKAIRNYFEAHAEIENSIKGTNKEGLLDEVNNISRICDFSYVNQSKMLGLGHAIYTGKGLIGHESFAVILPDDLCVNNGESVLKQMIQLHKKFPDSCIVAIEEVSIQNVSNYGVIEGKLLPGYDNVYEVTNMVEKPSIENAPSNLVIIGRYILNPEIFMILENTKPDKHGEIQITDALKTLAKTKRVIAYKFEGKRYDCGNLKGFLAATNYFAQKEKLI